MNTWTLERLALLPLGSIMPSLGAGVNNPVKY